jgi:hypothetical protein
MRSVVTVVTKEEMLAKKDDWLSRKDEIQSSFMERIEDPALDGALGLSLIGAGAGTIIINMVQRRRSVLGYLVGVAFVLLGVAVLGGTYRVRSGRISEAEDQVREQLAALDPIARAQVLRSMASEQVAPFINRGVPSN